MNNSEKSNDLLKQAETQIFEKYRADIEKRIGRAAMKETKQLKNIDANEDPEKLEVMKTFLNNESSDDGSEWMEQDDIEKQNPQMERATEVMQKAIRENFIGACREARSLEDQKIGYGMFYETILNSSRDKMSRRNPATDKIAEKIPRYDDEISKLAYSSPEAYTAIFGTKLRENIKNRKTKWMMETPYVEEHKTRLSDNMAQGRPTFIHGHLGSGKTELAITTAKEFMIKKKAEKEAWSEMAEYQKKHQIKNNTERAEKLGHFYRENYDRLKNRLSRGDKKAVEELNPITLSGAGDLRSSDLYVDKTLKLATYNGTDTAGHKDQYDAEFKQWKNEYQKNYDGLSDDERRERESRDNDEFFKLYLAKNQAYGTEVKLVTKPLLKAIEEGRPFIFDEVNAIPAAILISLNDILQRRPGDICYVPGKGQVKIKDGFSITMTGNLNTGNVNYFGTNELNPAFLSRLDVFEHGYLPQQESGRLNEQSDMSKNQLFQVMITYLADRQGNLTLPEIDESVNKLFRLAQFAHLTQRIYAGEHIESATYTDQSGDNVDVNFGQNVLSIRNILLVLEKWEKGRSIDLDKALWEGFISCVEDADARRAFLKLAQNFDFFSKKNGWDIDGVSGARVDFDDIHPEKYNYTCPPLGSYTMTDTVNLIYGQRPEREIYPEFTLEDLATEDDETLDEITEDDYEKLEDVKNEFEDTISALQVLAEQCGCSNTTDNSYE